MRLLIGLFLLLALNGCASGHPRDLSHAPEGEQSIRFWRSGTNERISVAYRVGGHYSEEAFHEIDHIFRDRQSGDEFGIDPELIELIAGLRDRMAMPPDTEIELLSGYRSPESNANLAKTNRHVAKDSYHMKGMAADIRIPDMIPSVLEAVAKTQQRGGVALYPDSGHVHVDTGPVRGWSVHRGFEQGLKRPGKGADKGKTAGRIKVIAPVGDEDVSPPQAKVETVVPLAAKPAPKAEWKKLVRPVKPTAGKKLAQPVKPALSKKPVLVKKAPLKTAPTTHKKPAVKKKAAPPKALPITDKSE